MEETLICTLCVTEKPVTEFYKNKGMPSGYANQCKKCVKARSKLREEMLRQDPEWVEKERTRGREKYHRLNYVENIQKVSKEKSAKYRKKYKNKIKARGRVSNILKRDDMHFHHWNYNDEFHKDVILLHYRKHAKIHRFLEYDDNLLIYIAKYDIAEYKSGDILDNKKKHKQYIYLVNKYIA